MSLPFLHSPADVIRWLLIQLGLGSDPIPWASGSGDAWPVFKGTEPNIPDACITLFDATPRQDGESQVDGTSFQHWGFQIRVRGPDDQISFQKAEAIRVMLNEGVLSSIVTVGVNRYMVYCVSGASLIFMGKDAPNSKRTIHTINAVSAIRRLS